MSALIRRYEATLTGLSPVLLHQDNFDFQEAVNKWRKTPENKKYSVAGDDRSPPWTWIGYTYHDGNLIGVSSDNLMTCFRNGGAKVLVPTGKHGQTFKGMTQLIFLDQILWPITINGQTVPWKPVEKLIGNMDFEEHKAVAAKLGFELFPKRAPVGSGKHIRVRPRFNTWELKGTMTVTEELLTTEVLQQILNCAGNYVGLCDWRPGGKTPGPFGRFSAVLKEI